MKKVLYISLILLVIFQSFIFAAAASTATVKGKEVSLSKGSEAIIPVEIDNNDGIMGFKIMLDYDPSIIKITSLTAGGITDNGNFTSNIGDKKGHIDIVWNHYENVSGAGTVFSISIKAIAKIKDFTEIRISYSQNDTFDANWEDVILACKNIKITGESYSESSINTGTTSPGQKATTNANKISDNQIIEAVQEVLNDLGYNSIDDLKYNDEFVFQVNQAIEKKTGVKNYYSDDFDFVKKEYINKQTKNLKKSILDNVEATYVKQSIQNALRNSSVSSIEKVKDTEKFISDVQKNLSEYYPNAGNIQEEIGNDKEIKLIKELYDEVNDAPSNDFDYLYLILCLIAVILCVFIVLIIIRGKAKSKDIHDYIKSVDKK